MSDTSELQHTPLHALHLELGARMVPFAGYSMPVQYPMGLMQEHLHTRQAAGLFDVSHMGQLRLVGEDAAAAFETLMPVDVVDLPLGKQRYGLLLNETGGIIDDLMFVNRGDDLFVIVNGACKHGDLAHILGNMLFLCIFADNIEATAQAPQPLQASMLTLMPSALTLIACWGQASSQSRQ